ncbi:MAG: hypothetical protein JO015_09670 [Verrucomicrobia bacterium]|nr:hypothetical protein [Verrucomicrobiota bacterium]
MQSLFAFLLQLFSKVWAAIALAFLTGGAAAVFSYLSADAGSTPKTGTQPVVVAPAGPFTHSPACNGSLPVVPEANTGLVLIPVVAAMLLLSSRRMLTAKAGEPSVDHESSTRPGF